ncbi:unnamed protein product [Paramecium sonneborni]|uniref:Uncharacterized protein n=1 Tax=Paramecium sonneborni TaxID=65129 RepID=A0A8S1K6T1_9CILI|nr:unnamed protein product [Paramecium sonneborni]
MRQRQHQQINERRVETQIIGSLDFLSNNLFLIVIISHSDQLKLKIWQKNHDNSSKSKRRYFQKTQKPIKIRSQRFFIVYPEEFLVNLLLLIYYHQDGKILINSEETTYRFQDGQQFKIQISLKVQRETTFRTIIMGTFRLQENFNNKAVANISKNKFHRRERTCLKYQINVQENLRNLFQDYLKSQSFLTLHNFLLMTSNLSSQRNRQRRFSE